MPDESPLQPRFVVWRCDHCRNGIEFDAVQLAGRSECRVNCPHCGQETGLQEPPPPPPLVPDEEWMPPAGDEVIWPEPGENLPVALPPEPLPPTHMHTPADVRWLTDLGVVYFKQHQFGEAFRCFRHAAKQGFATAQFCLAVCYFNGHGTARDESAALPWLQLAAAQGDANAEFTLALAYSLGRGVAPDAELAAKWMQQAAAHGHPEAVVQLRKLTEPAAPATAAAPGKNVEKRRHDLSRLVLGLFGRK